MSSAREIVYVVDDDPSVRKGLTRLLRSGGFASETFESAQQFLDQHDARAVGCAILDLAMPGVDGLRLQTALREAGSVLAIVFLTGHGDVPSSVQAMKQGALDFLQKPVGDDQLLAVTRAAIERSRKLDVERRELADIEQRLATLTPREREVLGHLVAGRLNKQVAADLGTVEHTVKMHRARIMEKMRVRSFAALVRLAQRAGIAGPPPSPR